MSKSKPNVDIRLKNIQFKSIWGSRPSSNYRSIVAIDDYEYVVPVGSGMMIFDNNTRGTRNIHLVNTNNNEILFVYAISSSIDLKYLATAVRMKDEDSASISILVYMIEHLRQEFRTPKKISYKYPSELPNGLKLVINSLAFSHDNQFVACGTNFPNIGVLIFDLSKGTLFHSISTGEACIPFHVTFNPSDASRLCITGENNLFKFWRFTAKKVQNPSSVNGLRGGKSINYTHHVWVSSAANEAVLIAASNKGFLCVIDGVEQKYPNVYAFGNAPTKSANETTDTDRTITQLLFRGDLVLALSESNEIAIFELRRIMQAKGINVQSPSLALLSKYRLSNVTALTGMEWCIRNSLTSFSVVGMSPDCLFEVDVIGDITTSTGGDVAKVNPTDLSSSGQEIATNMVSQPSPAVDTVGEKALIQFHSDSIKSMSVSARTNRLATNSSCDGTVRIWDFNQPNSFAGSWIIEDYKDLEEENPLHIDIHPSGLFAAFATEGIVKEFAISDGQLQLYRRIDIKVPFLGPSGTAHVISQPVSLVRYSNGGQYLAVISGKIAQVFNLYIVDYSTNVTGFPSRVMVMTDHISPITDIQFNRDDSMLFTSSSDGSVYGWKTGARVRHQEFVYRGTSATRIAISKYQKHDKDYNIIACFESSSENNYQSPFVGTIESKPNKPINKALLNSKHALNPQDVVNLDSPLTAKDVIKTAHNIEETSKKKNFLAIWKNGISATPQILLLDTPVKSISLGETDGPDKLQICVLGLADGRVLVSLLPLPFLRLDSSHIPLHINNSNQDQLSTRPQQQFGFGSSSSKQKGGILSNIENETNIVKSSNSTSSVNNSNNIDNISIVAIPSDNIEMKQSDHLSASSFNEQLDDKRCRQLNMHVGQVNEVVITQNGMWIFSGGQDGTIYMYATSKRGQELTQIPANFDSLEDRYHLMEKTRLESIHNHLKDCLHIIDSNTKDYELKLGKIVEEKNKIIDELQSKMQRELKHRDDTILQSRNEYTKLKNNLNTEIATLHKRFESSRSELELEYEQKLSKESLYLDKLKQAYDEYVVHSRLDLSDLQRKTDARIETIENERTLALYEAEKQKNTVLQYFDYVKLRNEELIGSLEEKQVEERIKLKQDLTNTKKELSAAQAAVLTGEVHLSRESQKLMAIIDEKESNLLKLQSNVDWAHGRIIDLEQALQKATAELVIRTEMSEKWELKTGTAQQKIIELEKLRKALTAQLHNLRQELGPKEESLLRVSEKLQETDREYEMSLQAIAEKEKALIQRGENLNLLQKQVRELRTTTARKEKVLRRAATLLEDYKFSLKEAYFNAEKRTIVTRSDPNDETLNDHPENISTMKRKGNKSNSESEIVEIIAQNEGMKSSLKRLTDVLIPFLSKEATNIDFDEEKDQVLLEQERHMDMLHRNVSILRANLDVAHSATESKVKNHLSDNQNLLKEVNNLRFEVRSLSMENQRLLAQIEFNNIGNKDISQKNFPNENGIKNINTNTPINHLSQKNVAVSSYDDLFSNNQLVNNGGSDFYDNKSYGGDEYENVRSLHRIANGALPPTKPKSMISKSESLPMFTHKDKLSREESHPFQSRTSAAHTSTALNSLHPSSSEFQLDYSQLNNHDNAFRDLKNMKPIDNKNEYSISADEKIRKLMEFNEQEIKTLKLNKSIKADTATFSQQSTPGHPPSRSSIDNISSRVVKSTTTTSNSLDHNDLVSLLSSGISKGIVLKGKESRSKPSTSNNESTTERINTSTTSKKDFQAVINETSLVSEGGSSLLNVSMFSDSIGGGGSGSQKNVANSTTMPGLPNITKSMTSSMQSNNNVDHRSNSKISVPSTVGSKKQR